MHELSIALSMLDLAHEELERRGGSRLIAIHLRIGPLSGVVPEAIESAFLIARAEYPFGDVQLRIERMPIVVRCARCGPAAAASAQMLRCPVCGGPPVEVASGRELEIKALEMC